MNEYRIPHLLSMIEEAGQHGAGLQGYVAQEREKAQDMIAAIKAEYDKHPMPVYREDEEVCYWDYGDQSAFNSTLFPSHN